jgi:hypothetical protein
MALSSLLPQWLAQELLRRYLLRARSTPAVAVVRIVYGDYMPPDEFTVRALGVREAAPPLTWDVPWLEFMALGHNHTAAGVLVNARVDVLLAERNDEAPPPVPPELRGAVAQACRLAGQPWTEAPL